MTDTNPFEIMLNAKNNLVYQENTWAFAYALVQQEAASRGYKYCQYALIRKPKGGRINWQEEGYEHIFVALQEPRVSWETDVHSPNPLWVDPDAESEDELADTGVSYSSQFVVFYAPSYNAAAGQKIYIYGSNYEGVRDEALRLMKKYITYAEPEKGVVSVDFWTNSRNGPSNRPRKLKVPDWEDIRENYSEDVIPDIEKLMDMSTDKLSGRLILWHGQPGTGKSYAIRALVKKWESWCEGQYIVDPEQFFGDSNYMTSVILSEDAKKKWFLIIIEDADELLTLDAKDRAGQSVARLLNLADGLIGQGLNILVLITTNEPITNIHPAMKRPGRCLANVEFQKFKAEEADEWLATHGAQGSHQSLSLAELYAARDGSGSINESTKTKRKGSMSFTGSR